jgi:hypothetical protein
MLAKYNQLRAQMSQKGSSVSPFPVMSFNMRLDMFEADPNNHFTKRINRIDTLFKKWYHSIPFQKRGGREREALHLILS